MTAPVLPSSPKGLWRSLPKWARIGLYFLMAFFLLVFLAWGALAWYLKSRKTELLAKVTQAVSEQIEGHFEIKDMEPALWKHFPNISIRLVGITLSDSLYPAHKKNLLELGSVYIKFSPLSLLTKNPKVSKITVADGSVYLFTDKDGYSNTYLLKKKERAGNEGGPKKKWDIDRFGIENVLFTYDQFERNKQFKVLISDMHGRIATKGDVMDVSTETNAHIYQLGFNLQKGGFVKNKDLEAPLHVRFHRDDRSLELPMQKVWIDDTPLFVQCRFAFGARPASYSIRINAPEIGFKESVSYLSRHIAQKLDSFDLKNKLAVQLDVNGSFQYPDTPLIYARWQTSDNLLSTSYGQLKQARFRGTFFNYYVAGKGKGDDNSAITFTGLQAAYSGIPFVADSVVLYGLVNPLMKLKIAASFPVEKLDEVLYTTFDMKSGHADLKLDYTGPVLSQDTFRHAMWGYIRIKDAALTYLPRNLDFKKCDIDIAFNGNDLEIKNTSLSSQKSTIKLEGKASNFMSVYFLDPGKVRFDWKINSSMIDLNEYKAFLAQRGKPNNTRTKKGNYKIAGIANRLGAVLEKSSMYLNVDVGKVVYRSFEARNIHTDLSFTEDGISLGQVRLQHAGGKIDASAHIGATGGSSIPFEMRAKVEQVKINDLFFAFENFGQGTLTYRNLKGLLSAQVDLRGSLKSTGELMSNSLNGKVDFQLGKGELNDFPPFETIKKFVFKKRNLSHITFNELKNSLSFHNGKMKISPMSIESSALTIRVDGIYAFDKGTDISIAIPLRNPQKDSLLIAQGKRPQKDRGIVVYLRAQDGDNGKVNINWDPLKKGVRDSTSNADVMME